MPTPTDVILDRAAKIAGILVPFIVAGVGLLYSAHKDAADDVFKRNQYEQQTTAMKDQMEQQQFNNFTALLPLIRSSEDQDPQLLLQIFTSEAGKGLAPLGLLPVIEKLKVAPSYEAQLQKAVTAGRQQQASQCNNTMPDGVYIHIQNKSQRDAAEKLGHELAATGLKFQGVQLVDVVPLQTDIRYYPAATPPGEIDKIAQIIRNHGQQEIRANDISYLLRGCPARPRYEIWLATDAVL